MEQDTKRTENRVDKAVDMTFPASDAPAHGGATATEPPARPADRQAPQITMEQIKQAQRGEGHKHQAGSSRPGLRQGTRPRATVSVLLLSLALAAAAGVVVLAYFTIG